MDVTLKQLRYFVALAETGGFGLAAAQVHVTQPALSTQIREMEDRLGTKLVERLPREIRLTRAGQDVLVRSRRILAEVEELAQSTRLKEGLRGRLNLGVIPTVAPYLLPLALTRIRARDLTLELRVREAQTDRLVEALRLGRLDAAVMALPVSEPGLRADPIATDRFVLAGSISRIATWADRAERLRPTEVSPDQLLLLDEGHCLADQALEVCAISARRQVDLGASSLSTLVGLVSEGFGLTLLPEIAIRTETASAPRLALMRFAAPEPSRTLALVRRQSSVDAAWADDLAEILRDAAAELIGMARDRTAPAA
ncbi:hydrogen peroxide-inducible genes activator [Pelagovum pacificum]|uniref:LysR family transcriptional regulator n=1 Tax=Pelagovum pacificum TaxID=2588711 RepID=A0A5C5GEN1_9RHOB|nr:hydrogen peroxide-inducible genes activator [Pelagovum pacificum]QQA44828.1 LysR family transcriptional regulator [Pelagovum pacificum]TNY32066.1 LysR family transcriptional regulator [Pelagovum pacificum]